MKVVKFVNFGANQSTEFAIPKRGNRSFYHIPAAVVQKFIRFLASLLELKSIATLLPSVFKVQQC